MNVVDSSGWLEYFANGPDADFFAGPIQKPGEMIVPTLSIYEVFKRVVQQADESAGLRAVAVMQQGQVVELTLPLALSAAKLSAEVGLPMVDSVMLATAQAYGAVLWTQDAHFDGIGGVKYYPPHR